MKLLKLNPTEVAIARELGRLRDEHQEQRNREQGKKPFVVANPNHTQRQINEYGAGGELAIAKYYNCYPDFSYGLDHAGYDLILPTTHQKIDVKVSLDNYKNVAVPKMKARFVDQCDVYIFLKAVFNGKDFPGYEVQGYAEPREIFKPEYIRDDIKLAAYLYPIHKLNKLR